jgi:hypothetical protein
MAGQNSDQTWHMAAAYPGLYFAFWPSLIAFSLEHIFDLALELFTQTKKAKSQFLELVLFDHALVRFLTRPGSDVVFSGFLRGLATEQSKLYLQMRRFAPMLDWPKELAEAFKQLRSNKAP